MIKFHYQPNFDKSLHPVQAGRYREWWEKNDATVDHAKHCLPLTMANSLGYYILSPATFEVYWDGNENNRAQVRLIEKSSHCEVDNHAANGSFVVQPGFIPVTTSPGDFVFVKSIPNERRLYQCMEACIEAWWNVGRFGLVFLLLAPGTVSVYMGQPIAQIFMFSANSKMSRSSDVDGFPEGFDKWDKKRNRPGYQKDFDYLRGLTPDGTKVATHITNWKEAGRFDR